MALAIGGLSSCVHQGVLQKRCRFSWSPRHVEIISEPSDIAGHNYSFHLLIYDHRKQMLKKRVHMESIVTIRASRDCFFQIFLTDGKIMQFKTESIDSQAHWMAMIKLGLGKEHAMLYSIGLNLPAHRVGQLDRVLVLASPINDINLHAWDLNRVKCFIELDIGIRMELCPACVRGQQSTLTFILEKKFIKDCMSFLRKEARISQPPEENHGLLIHTIPHQCFINTPPADSAPLPPPYSKDPPPAHVSVDVQPPDNNVGGSRSERESVSSSNGKAKPVVHFEDSFWDDSESGTGSFSQESLFLPDGSLTKGTFSKSSDLCSHLPPRTIPRQNYESSIPAMAHPYLRFQPHLFSHFSKSHFEAPYQISSRIIITDSGEVQFERNVMGSIPNCGHGKFHFKKQMPIPPRGLRSNTNTEYPNGNPAKPLYVNASVTKTEPVVESNGFSYLHTQSGSQLPGKESEYVNIRPELDGMYYPTAHISTPPVIPRRYKRKLKRIGSDSELDYAAKGKVKVDVTGSSSMKRVSQTSSGSDIYSDPKVHFSFASSSVQVETPPIPERQLQDEPNGDSSDILSITETVKVENAIENTIQSSSLSPVPKPRKKVPTPKPRKNIHASLQRSKSTDSVTNLENDSEQSAGNAQKEHPVPRPRTKTNLQVSCVSLSTSEGDIFNMDSQASYPSSDATVNSNFHVDSNGIGVSDV